MIETSAQKLAESFLARLDRIERVEDGLGLLAEMVEAFAGSLAETLFLKVQTEPGWTSGAATAAANATFEQYALAIADSVHAFGGTIEMVHELNGRAGEAYRARFAQLSAGMVQGGAA